jgi:hypothetical protein
VKSAVQNCSQIYAALLNDPSSDVDDQIRFFGDRVLKVPRDPTTSAVDEGKLAESLRSAVRGLTVALGID